MKILRSTKEYKHYVISYQSNCSINKYCFTILVYMLHVYCIIHTIAETFRYDTTGEYVWVMMNLNSGYIIPASMKSAFFYWFLYLSQPGFSVSPYCFSVYSSFYSFPFLVLFTYFHLYLTNLSLYALRLYALRQNYLLSSSTHPPITYCNCNIVIRIIYFSFPSSIFSF